MKFTRSPQRRRALCAVHRRAPRALTLAALLGLAASPAVLHAVDFNYNNATGNFSTGFTPAVAGATTADDLIFGGTAYTATDDVSALNVNGVRFNNSGAVTVARGAGDNNVNLGGANPYLNFNNTGLVTLANDHTFTASGYIVKSSSPDFAANPIITGAVTLNAGVNVQVVLADTGGDAAAELAINGAIAGAGTLTLQNNAAVPAALAGNAGIAAPANQQDYGTLLVSGNNTGFTGATNVNAGRLVITSASALGSGVITVGGANTIGTINSTGGTFGFGNTNEVGGGAIGAGVTIPNALNLAGATTGNYGHGLENNVGNNTVAGPVTLTGANVFVSVNGGTTLTLGSGANGVTETPGLGAVLTKQTAGTLILNNASYTGGTSIQGGAVQFNGTAPAAGTITIGATAAQSASALNVGTGTAFPTLASAIPLVNTASFGALALTGDNAEALDFDNNNFGGNGLSLGSAVPATATLPNGVTYTGVSTGTFVNLGGGTVNGKITLPNANQVTGGAFLTVGPIGTNGIVYLANANDYSGGTAIAGGTLEIAGAASLGTGGLSFGGQLVTTPAGNGGTLQFAPGGTNNLAANDVTVGRTVSLLGAATIDTNGNNVTFTGNFAGNNTTAPGGTFTKRGAGTLTLQGAVNGGGTANGATNIFVNQGTLALDGPAAVFNTSGYTSIGVNAGDVGTFALSGGAQATINGDFNSSDNANSTGTVLLSGAATALRVTTLFVGKGDNTSGVFNQTGGSLADTNGPGDWRIGNNATSVGTYDLSGGTLSTNGNFQPGATGTGQLTISGTGAATVGAFPSVGRFTGSYGVLNVLGGSFNQTNTGSFLIVGEAGTGILNVGYGGAGATGTVTVAGTQLRVGNGAGAVGTVNLGTGGVVQARAVNTVAGSTSVVNFHGGTLTATAAGTTFMQGLTGAYIYGEGGTIDTGANAVTIAQPLLAPGAGGVQTIAIANGGAGYQGSPVIKITGAGVGASAIPVLANGVLTAITITNPGNAYSAPAVTISGGNPATAATLGAVTLGASTSGALTKIGTGTLTLTGTSTYTGGTLINAGVLVAGANGTLGTGNVTIASAATLTINAGLTDAIADAARVNVATAGGAFGKLNLLSTTETVNSLILGGTPQNPGTYGSSASAATFKDDNYFTGAGILNVTSVVPEPGTWALLGLGVVVLGAVEHRRRRQAA